MNVFITGGAGFIGSHLADRLVARGDSVLVLDNFATARRDNVQPGERLEVVEGSVADTTLVPKLLERFHPDVVVHAAASYKDPDDWYNDALVNTAGTANVVKATLGVGTPRLIYFQTALCYGVRPEEQPITLDHPLRPGNSSYAISKTAGEQYVQLAELDYVSFRLANAYGPRNLSGPLPTFFQRLQADKPCFVVDTRRDFVYVADLIDCVEAAVDGVGHGVYHVSSGSDYAIEDLYRETVKALGVSPSTEVEVRRRSPDDAPTILLDPSRTKADFGWEARTPLGEGVARAVEYYRDRGVEETFTHLRLAKD